MTFNRQFSLALEALTGLKLKTEATKSLQAPPVPPALERILANSGPLPAEALFLGIASDGLPVLLNLHNPLPGPMLVAGDSGAGKTEFLRSMARSLIHTHVESDVQYGVITGRVHEWEQLERTAHRIGVFDVTHAGSQDLLISLASWAHSNKNSQQSILLLMDDLEAVAKMDLQSLQSLRWLLLRGPARRVWPVITLNAERYGQVLAWIEIFRTRVFGKVSKPHIAQAICNDPASALDQLEAGTQFTLRENGNWIKFNLPSF